MKKRNPRTKLIALVIAMIAVIIMIASAAGKGQQASQFEHWSPDGTKIVFTSDGNCFALVEKVAFTTTRDNPTCVPIQNAAEIYLMNPDGSDPERITDNLRRVMRSPRCRRTARRSFSTATGCAYRDRPHQPRPSCSSWRPTERSRRT